MEAVLQHTRICLLCGCVAWVCVFLPYPTLGDDDDWGAIAVTSKVMVGDPEIEGALSGVIVKKAIRRSLHYFNDCLKDKAVSPGEIHLNFTINGSGSLGSSEVSQNSYNGGTGACFIESMQQVQLPVPRDGEMVTVHFPFHVVLDFD